MFRKGIVLTGSGGQGVITASIILAEAAALYENLNAVQAQSYGPEARGGATRADVILSDETVHYPKVIKPHVLVCLTQLAYNKYGRIIRPGGLILTDNFYVREKHKLDAKSYHLDMYKSVMEAIGNPIVFNICVLGVLSGLTDLVGRESLTKVLKTKVPSEYFELNVQALDLGLELAAKARAANSK